MTKESRFSTSKMLQEDFNREVKKPSGGLVGLLYQKHNDPEVVQNLSELDDQTVTTLDVQTPLAGTVDTVQLKDQDIKENITIYSDYVQEEIRNLDNQKPDVLDNRAAQITVAQKSTSSIGQILNTHDNQNFAILDNQTLQNPFSEGAEKLDDPNKKTTRSLDSQNSQPFLDNQKTAVEAVQNDYHLDTDLANQTGSKKRNLDGRATKQSTYRTPKTDWRKYEKNRERSGARGRWDCRPLNSILNKVEHYMVDAKLTKQDWFERASMLLMEYLDNQKIQNLDGNTSTDDDRLMMVYSTTPSIINLYRRITENKWTARDDIVGIAYNERDIKIIEIAMIRTRIRSMRNKTVIKWFKYFKDEIDDHLVMLAETPPMALEAQLMSGRKLLDLAKKGIEVDA